MDEKLKARLAKIYELVKRGSTLGEQQAAKTQLDKMVAKYNLINVDLEALDKDVYRFKYRTELDVWLLERVVNVLTSSKAWDTAIKNTWKVKEVKLNLTYLDWITVETAYQYFKRHMASQWEKVCASEVKKTRKAKTRKARIEQLREPFFSRYVVVSKLYKDGELSQVNTSELSSQELRDRYLVDDLEGGQFNRQVTNGLYLEN